MANHLCAAERPLPNLQLKISDTSFLPPVNPDACASLRYEVSENLAPSLVWAPQMWAGNLEYRYTFLIPAFRAPCEYCTVRYLIIPSLTSAWTNLLQYLSGFRIPLRIPIDPLTQARSLIKSRIILRNIGFPIHNSELA